MLGILLLGVLGVLGVLLGVLGVLGVWGCWCWRCWGCWGCWRFCCGVLGAVVLGDAGDGGGFVVGVLEARGAAGAGSVFRGGGGGADHQIMAPSPNPINCAAQSQAGSLEPGPPDLGGC